MDRTGPGHVFRHRPHSTSTAVLKSLQSDLRKPHSFWLTNRRNIPTVINAVAKIPTTNDTTQCRLTVGFDPAPFCAAPMPNQKRRSSDLLPSRIRHDVVGGVVRASNIDDQTPVVAEGGEEFVCEVRPPNSTVTDFDRVIDQPADLKSSSCTAVIISSHRRTVAMMNSIHTLL
jgi:hypothetical protein